MIDALAGASLHGPNGIAESFAVVFAVVILHLIATR